MPLEFNCTTFE